MLFPLSGYDIFLSNTKIVKIIHCGKLLANLMAFGCAVYIAEIVFFKY